MRCRSRPVQQSYLFHAVRVIGQFTTDPGLQYGNVIDFCCRYLEIVAVDDNEVDGPQTVTISATAAGYSSIDDTVNVLDNEFLSLSIDQLSLYGESQDQLTQLFDAAEANNTTVPTTVPFGVFSSTVKD